MSKILKAHIALFTVNAIYGANTLIAKGVMPQYLTANAFIAIRVVGATLLFWLLSAIVKTDKIQKADWPRLLVCGLFGVTINQLCFFHGLSLSSAFNTGVIMTLSPILVAILAFFILKERLSGLKIGGILLGAIGAALLTTRGAQSGDSSLLGDFLLLVNAMSYAIYLIIVTPLMKKYSAITVTKWVFTFGMIYIYLFPPVTRDLFAADFSGLPAEVWYKIVFVIVAVTFLTYLLTMYAMETVSATITSTYIYFQPIMVVLFTFLFAYLGWSADYTKSITWEKMCYMLTIFIGVYVVTRSEQLANKLKFRQ